MSIENPSFLGDGYIQYSPLEDVSRSTMIQFVFRPNSLEDGLLLYAGENQFGSGDYIALLLRSGYAHILYKTLVWRSSLLSIISFTGL